MTAPSRRSRPLRALAVASSAAALVLGLSACGGDDDSGVIELSVGTFNEFGYEGLIEEWNAANPDIQVSQRKVGTWDDAKANLQTKLAAGSGLSDIEAVEADFMPALVEHSDLLADLSGEDVEGRWLDFKEEAGTDEDGRLVGYGTDIGPEGICFRGDLLAEAGLPSTREEFAKAIQGGWDDYFALGEEFVAAMPEVAWYDSSGSTAQAMLNQVEYPFGDEDNTIAVENPELENVYSTITANIDKGLSTTLAQFSDDWTSAFQNNGFATMACPGWMLGIVEGNAAGVEGWDFADAFPGGGGDWGGSYLVVPAQGDNIEAAREFAAWVTAPEQQLKAYQARGTFPSQTKALDSPVLEEDVREFFNNAPVGEILASRAEAIEVQPYKGPFYSDILSEFQAAILRVDDGSSTASDSWDQFVTSVERLD